jgi:hypothetical protein
MNMSYEYCMPTISQEKIKEASDYFKTQIVKGRDCTMRFFEFNDFGYYALIGAESEETAIEFFKENVADITENDGVPDEMTTDEVKAKLLKVCEGGEDAEDVKNFEEIAKSCEPYLFVIDGSLV